MKSVLLSIKPKYCELIASGKKTIEVRKTKPKQETPFKCLIYCTKSRHHFVHNGIIDSVDDLYRLPDGKIKYGYSGELMLYDGEEYSNNNFLNGKVIGEFVCNSTVPLLIKYSDPDNPLSLREFPYTGLTDRQIIEYLGNGKQGYGWHISNLVIYDEPKEISEFKKYNRKCHYSDLGLATPKCSECTGCNLKRPPLSWCYVEREV